MAFHLTTEGAFAQITQDDGDDDNQRCIASKDEWETVAGQWPLKRLVRSGTACPESYRLRSSRAARSHSSASGALSSFRSKLARKQRRKRGKQKFDSGKVQKPRKRMPCCAGRTV